MRKGLSFSICIVVCVVIGWLVVGSRKVNAVDVGEPAPDYALTDALSGNTISLVDCRGKVVLLDFFATYCSHCREAFDNDLVPLYNQAYVDDPYVVFLSINIKEPGISAETLGSFAEEHDVTWPVLMGSDSNIAQVYGVTIVPTIFIIDGDGVITLRYNGGSPGAETLKEEIDAPRVPLAVDTNSDGIVNASDLFVVAVAFGSTSGGPNWNPAADITNDDSVDVSDLSSIKNHFGNTA